MPYQTNIPNQSQSPGLFPSQCSDNFTRLKAIISANHKFNDSAGSDDGYHQIVQWLPVDPSTVPNNPAIGQSFVSSTTTNGHLFHKDEQNNLYQITPTLPIRAAVNFNGFSPVAIRYAYNVSSVTRTGTGTYTINFTNPMPSNNYVVCAMNMRDSGTGIIEIRDSSTYSNIFTTNSIQMYTSNTDGAARDMIAVCVVIFGG